MVAIDITAFAKEKWSGYKKSITDISKSKDTSLVENDMEVYCFDDICATPNKALLAKRILLCSLFAGKETG